MAMDTTDQAWRNVEGERLTMPVTKDHADQKTLVVDTGDLGPIYAGVTALGKGERAIATFEVGEGMGLHHGRPEQTHHYQSAGQEWVSGGSTALPESSVGNMRVSLQEGSEPATGW